MSSGPPGLGPHEPSLASDTYLSGHTDVRMLGGGNGIWC